MSKLHTTKNEKVFGPIPYDQGKIKITVRYDDTCGNGHNTLSVTADYYEGGRLVSCGCMHDDIRKAMPELQDAIKFHLCSTDGPMYYIANTLYWIKEGNLDHARSTAIWPDADLADFTRDNLEARLPGLMKEFRRVVESFGFEY